MIKIEQSKLDGSSLIYAIIIMVLVSCLSLLVLAFWGINNRSLAVQRREALAELYSIQGLKKIISDTVNHNMEIVTEPIVVTLSKNHWGMYDVCASVVLTSARDTILKRIALIGKAKNFGEDIALILENSSYSLLISDNVTIRGKSYVPGGSVRFYRNKNTENSILSSQLFESPVKLPEYGNMIDVQAWLRSLSNKREHGKLTISDSLNVSFAEDHVTISADTVILEGSLSGHIMVLARQVFIRTSAKLQDAIVLASSISVDSGFSGVGQLFATKSIVIGENVCLKYPSAVAMFPHLYGRSDMPGIILAFSLHLEGEAVLVDTNKYTNSRSRISMVDSNSVVGGIYSTSPIRFEGRCLGPIVCNSTTSNVDGNVQQNILLNTIIDASRMPDYYSYNLYFPLGKNKQVVKWLN
ncbi:MAG: hypothetical protein EOP56_18880 [Sphingobacteriales bacterium]|nr:MAG: hypothetical protein EOP56_18880 [Sphingobacteriales bacterium]